MLAIDADLADAVERGQSVDRVLNVCGIAGRARAQHTVDTTSVFTVYTQSSECKMVSSVALRLATLSPLSSMLSDYLTRLK